MRDLDLVGLRKIAEAAGSDWHSPTPTPALRTFHEATYPPTVIQLIDRIAELETYLGGATVQEYGEVYPHGGDDGETVTLHKHFGDDKTRPLEEGFALGTRWVGPWTQIGEVQRYV